MPLYADDVMAAVRHTAEHCPDLDVLVTPHCGDASWAVNIATATVYVAGHLPPDVWSAALLDALEELCTQRQVPAPRGLRLVHSSTTRECEDTRTGWAQ